jgi:siroheme synthase
VISGHAAGAYGAAIDSIAPGALTLVVLMGLATRGELASRLVARGWAETTPAAIVLGASHREEARWIGTLGTLGAAEIASEQPGVIVVGEVVRFGKQLGLQLGLEKEMS